MYANHRHYILFVVALLTFIVTTLGYAYVRSRVYEQANNSAALLVQVSQMEEQKKREQDLSSFYSKMTEEQKQISGLVLNRERVVEFIEFIERIGSDTSTELELSNIQTNQIVKTAKIQDNFTTLRARVQVKGNWPNVMRALTLIENAPYGISLNNVRLNEMGSVSASTTRKVWNLDMDIKVLTLD
jgi:hypothetical protein